MVGNLVKILLADDHALFRDVLVQYLERAYENVRVIVAADFMQAIKILEKDQDFKLILLDYRMPGMGGLEGLHILRRDYPEIPVALMSGVAQPETVSGAIAAGAAGYFPKTLSGKDLLYAVKMVLAGERYIPVDHNQRIMPSYYTDEDTGLKAIENEAVSQFNQSVEMADTLKLTPRERQVLQYLMRGQPNKEIANDLGLQLVTVKLHVRGICRKLNVANRTQAAIRARELSLFL